MTQDPIGPSGVDELIGARVHAAMWRTRVTQKQLAAALGVDQGSVSKRLRGRTAWKVSDVIVAAQLCGVSVEDLMPQHDELGHVKGLTRGDVAAESRCTQPLPEGTPLSRAAQAWGAADLVLGDGRDAAADLTAPAQAVAR